MFSKRNRADCAKEHQGPPACQQILDARLIVNITALCVPNHLARPRICDAIIFHNGISLQLVDIQFLDKCINARKNGTVRGGILASLDEIILRDMLSVDMETRLGYSMD